MKKHLNNLLLILLNFILAAVASSILEYEVSKSQKPWVGGWLPTPVVFDWIFGVAVGLVGVINLAVLALIYIKGLENRRYLWDLTLLGWVLLAIIIVVLKDKFLPVVWPWV